jgi:hypothetical protein
MENTATPASPAVQPEPAAGFDRDPTDGIIATSRAPGSFRDDPLPPGADTLSLIRVCYDHDDATVAALLAACEAAGVPAGPINDMDAVFADPQVIARGLALDMDGLKGVRSPFTFSGHDLSMSCPAPMLGADD